VETEKSHIILKAVTSNHRIVSLENL